MALPKDWVLQEIILQGGQYYLFWPKWPNSQGVQYFREFMVLTLFSAIVVTKRTERMAITEGSVLQEIILHVNLIKLRSYITAPDPGPDELQTPPMDGTVDLPQIQVALRRDVV